MAPRERDLAAVASLNEPIRRRLYRYVADCDESVGRDEAASALSIPRSVASFHLDKLAVAGLLEVEFRRPPGKSGPGAGRPAKRYRPVHHDVSFSVPDRRYQVAARLLARAIAKSHAEGVDPVAASRQAAREYGTDIGRRGASHSAKAAELRRVAGMLEDEGYEPSVTGGCIHLANCPFHAVAEEQRELICGMNVALIEGALDGAGIRDLVARLEPAPGRCCVTISK